MQGRSLVPLLQRRQVDWPDEVFIQISESQVGRAVRTRRWKYGVEAPGASGWDDPGAEVYRESYLFDLEADPFELSNLIGSEAHRGVAGVMRERLLRRLGEAGEAKPTIEEAPRRPLGQRRVSAEEERM